MITMSLRKSKTMRIKEKERGEQRGGTREKGKRETLF